jgi:hypothetical protein
MNGDNGTPRESKHAALIEVGRGTRFGDSWTGQRCLAKTRGGSPCQKAAIAGKGRCRLHGGASTGPRTVEGRARIAAANFKHGNRTKERLAENKALAQSNREIWAAFRAEVALMKAGGYLPKGWSPWA